HHATLGLPPLIEALPVEVLHRVPVVAVTLTAAVDRHDVGVVQARRNLGLAAEALELIAGQQRGLRQHLQRDAAIQRFLYRLKYHAHAAATQFALNAEVTETFEF